MPTALLALILAINSMAFPASFPNSPSGYDFGLTAYGNKHPSFEYGGALWSFMTQVEVLVAATPEQDYKCHAMMSTDGGNTWAEQDAANAPGDPPPAPGITPNFSNRGNVGVRGPQYSVAVDGSTALIFSVQLANTVATVTSINRNQLIKFNLSTKQWNNSYVTPTKVVDIQRNGTALATSTVGTTYAQLVVLGANDYVLIFSSTSEVIAGFAYSRISYARFDGTTMGAVVALPSLAGNAFDYWPQDAVLDENGIIHICYQDNNFSGLTTAHHVSLDTGSWTFGTAQNILTANSYWGPQYSAAMSSLSKLIAYTPSGGTQKIAFVTEVNDPTLTFQTLSFYYADAVLNPTWNQVDITSGVDVTSGPSGQSASIKFPIPQVTGGTGQGSVSLSEKSGTIAVAWNNAIGYIPDRVASVIYSTAPSNTLAFSAPAVLFTTGPIVNGQGDNNVMGVDTFPMTGGVGVLAPTLDLTGSGGEIMQFSLVPIGGPATIPTVIPGDSGRKTTPLTPNQFDFCLHREYRLFCNIDYDAKGCARLPKCFTIDEREWGDQA